MFEDSAKVGKPPNSTESVAGQNDGFGAKPEAVHLEQELPLSAESCHLDFSFDPRRF